MPAGRRAHRSYTCGSVLQRRLWPPCYATQSEQKSGRRLSDVRPLHLTPRIDRDPRIPALPRQSPGKVIANAGCITNQKGRELRPAEAGVKSEPEPLPHIQV